MITHSTSQKGFTLIELMVSVAIFSFVVVIALGALLSLSVADRKAETLKSAIDNLSFAMDSMSRAIRTGNTYHCNISTGTITNPQDCSSPGSNTISLITSTGARVYYQLDTSSGTCGQTGTIGCIERSSDGSTWFPITSPDVVIQNSGTLFHVVGTLPGSGDNVQPRVIMTLKGSVQLTATLSTTFSLQSSVTQRIYDQ
jgi:prepilin-type N-terminal cleavage/methylation domain-containing protein